MYDRLTLDTFPEYPNIGLSIGTVTTGAPGTPAAASVSGEAPGQILNLTIPQGANGPPADPTALNNAVASAQGAATLAAGWASTADDTDVPGAPTGSRSAKNYADKAALSKVGADASLAGAQAIQSGLSQAYGAAPLVYATYATLAATTAANGLYAFVAATDTGTHTDPVVGGTVSNNGRFQYSTSPAGWKWIDATQPDAGAKNAVVSSTTSQQKTLGQTNLFDLTAITTGQTLVRATGALTAQATTYTTDYMPVVPGSTVVASADGKGDATYGGTVFYDYNFKTLSGVALVTAGTTIAVPAGAAWMRQSYDTSKLAATLMIVTGTAIPANYKRHDIPDTMTARGNFFARKAETDGLVNVFDPTSITSGYYLTSNINAQTANATYYITSYIPVQQGGQITFNASTTLSSPFGLTWYDNDGTFLQGAAGQGTPPVAGTPYTVPFGAAYVRATFPLATVPPSKLVAVQGSVLPGFYLPHGLGALLDYQSLWAGANVMHLGDSITANYAGVGQWPDYVAKRMRYTIIANNAKAGRVMRDLPFTPGGTALQASDFANVDTVIMKAGTNDFNAARTGSATQHLGSISDASSYGAASFYANTKYVLDTLYGLKSTLRIVAMTPQYRSSASGLAATDQDADGNTLYAYADAVKAVCGQYGVPVLDLIRTAGMNSYNAGSYLQDGLHPNATDAGVTIIGKPLASWLGSVRGP